MFPRARRRRRGPGFTESPSALTPGEHSPRRRCRFLTHTRQLPLTRRCYSTAEEGALAYARSIGHEAAALEAAAADAALPASEMRAATRASMPRSDVDLTAEEALAASTEAAEAAAESLVQAQAAAAEATAQGRHMF